MTLIDKIAIWVVEKPHGNRDVIRGQIVMHREPGELKFLTEGGSVTYPDNTWISAHVLGSHGPELVPGSEVPDHPGGQHDDDEADEEGDDDVHGAHQ